MMKMREFLGIGLFHIHSTYSYDGHVTIQEWREFALRNKIRFLFFSEHSDDFTDAKMKAYVSECQRYSDSSVVCIPGIEYRCENNDIHLLVYGCHDFIMYKTTTELLEKVKRLNAVSIIAHPICLCRENKLHLYKDIFNDVSGVEVWNTGKESRLVPHYHVSKAVYALTQDKKCRWTSGIDAHVLPERMNLLSNVIRIPLSSCVDEAHVVDAIRKGSYRYGNRICNFDGSQKYVSILWVRSLVWVGNLLVDLLMMIKKRGR